MVLVLELGISTITGIEKELMDKLLAVKDAENQSLKEEIKYLKEKIDQLMEVVGKK